MCQIRVSPSEFNKLAELAEEIYSGGAALVGGAERNGNRQVTLGEQIGYL